jgi:hypothetical protein
LCAPEALIEHNRTYGLQIVIIEAVFIFEEVFESADSLRFIKRLFSQEWKNSSLSTSFLTKG